MEILLKYFSDFTPTQLDQFRSLDALYREWNERINVISRKDLDGLYEKHVLHSLSIAAAIEFSDNMEVLDLGTGGGFPGIPLAIYFPKVQFHLVDSIGKKLKVVDAIASSIGLQNVSTRHGRAEEIKNTKFDFVVSRAVAPLKDLWKWSKPLLKAGSSSVGRQDSQLLPGLLCLKGGDLRAEIKASGMKPRIKDIAGIFPEVYFKEKFLLYQPR